MELGAVCIIRLCFKVCINKISTRPVYELGTVVWVFRSFSGEELEELEELDGRAVWHQKIGLVSETPRRSFATRTPNDGADGEERERDDDRRRYSGVLRLANGSNDHLEMYGPHHSFRNHHRSAADQLSALERDRDSEPGAPMLNILHAGFSTP